MPYLMYLRKSRADLEAEQHGEGETLARHEKILSDLANKLKLNVTAIYREIVSGESIAARPEVQRLLREVESGMWDGVLVVEVERLARGDTMDQGQVAKSFKLNGTKIITPMKIYDPNNEFDEEYFEFGLFMSRREYKTINRRLQRGRIASVKEGKIINSTAPYGYRKVKIPNEKGYTLEIIQEEAKIVTMIFELYTKGELNSAGKYVKIGAPMIARKLDSLQIKPRMGGNWSPSSIRDILKNPTYLGKVRWQWKKETTQFEDGCIKKKRKRTKDYMLYDGIHPSIIEQETFDLAQLNLQLNKKNGTSSSKQLQNPLTGIIYCKKCGSLMTRLARNSKTQYDAIKCSNRYCDNVSAPLYLVERELINSLKDWLNDFTYKWGENIIDEHDNKINLLTQAFEQWQKSIESLKQQLNKIFDFLEKGIYTTEIFIERKSVLDKQIEEANENMLEISKQLKDEEKRKSARTTLIPKVKKLLDVYNNLTVIEKNETLKEIVYKVEYVKYVRNTRTQRELVNFELEIFPRIQ